MASYTSGHPDRFSYSIIGTFGAGKTQLLGDIDRLARDKNSVLIFLECIT
jgi:hypothetical protein